MNAKNKSILSALLPSWLHALTHFLINLKFTHSFIEKFPTFGSKFSRRISLCFLNYTYIEEGYLELCRKLRLHSISADTNAWPNLT
jgi:hypothetical protein